MKTPVIEYGPVPVHSPGSRWWMARVVGWVVVLAAGVGLGMQGCTTEFRMDAVTGSSTSRTTGPLGMPLGTRVDVSPLEVRLKRMRVQWRADWRFLSEVNNSLFDMSRACASAPEIFTLRSVMKEFVEASTDDEIRAFVRVMETGTEAEQRAAVEGAADKVFHGAGGK